MSCEETDLETIYKTAMENADFEEVRSVDRAHAFVTAAKRYLFAAPMSQNDQGSSVTINTAQIENLMKRALDFIAAADTSASYARVSFLGVGCNFR